MIIKKIEIKNIRSYVSQEIEFPEGKVLLSGNIGSGKSTVLLSIDFALFGLRRSELSGASLLRNGEDKGSVKLVFVLDGKEVVVYRSLKRTNNSVVQDSAYIMQDGIKSECTAVELKQKVLELLNYPQELITKNKHMIYQYTVYTPQEQMKQILLGDKEFRLDTLRRVFGIDKYKRIVANAKIVISKLREKRKEFEGIAYGLEANEADYARMSSELLDLRKQQESVLPALEMARKNVDEARKDIADVEAKIEEIKIFKNKADLLSVTITHKNSARNEKLEKLRQIKEQIAKIESETSSCRDCSGELAEKRAMLEEKNRFLMDKQNKLRELVTLSNVAKEIKDKISALDECPTCYQKVEKEHKLKIFKDSEKRISDISLQIGAVNQSIQLIKDDIEKLNRDIDALTEQQRIFEVFQARIKDTETKKKEKEIIVDEIARLGREIEDSIQEREELVEKTLKLPSLEQQYEPLKKELENRQKLLLDLEKRKVEVETRISSVSRMIRSLEEEIQRKRNVRKRVAHIAQFQQWLQEYFINLMGVMEKNIMLKVHSDFSNLFEKWFGILIDSDVLSMKLDDEFSPLIEQNGYNIDYENLSGGEKTAAALAYRLALNQVINDMMSSIKTRGLLILDEPTDGFSSEQLERMKSLLDELNLVQVIIVSHEPKIESFVDNVIKFEKKEHVSSAVF